MTRNDTKNSESDSANQVNQKSDRIKLDANALTRMWIKIEKEIREAHPHKSLRSREEFLKRRLIIRPGFPSPEILAQWWQEAESQIKLAHPHESFKTRQKLTEKYVHSRLRKYLEHQYIEPHPEEKLISEWYREELLKLREESPHKPLKERERIAAMVVEEKIKQYRKTIRLDEFFD
ncbi:MAG: hypothetical protein JSW11_10130 [Candidatus Heimdallarchaeota archaeon]|nr:MAG: hypothetical protein JSW11_10130 [Candidatus Heimdallarchaeota archaeon]